jgi:ABC-type sugar transport system substrate-binding protein
LNAKINPSVGSKILFIAILLIVVITTRCQASTGQGSPSQTAVRVAIVPPSFTSPFHVAVKEGTQKGASELGWQVDVVAAERESDFAGQVAVVEQEIQKGVKAIGVNPIDAKAIVTAVNKANEAGVPILRSCATGPV